jgi:tRNA dimethylallyltransferase
MSDMEPVLAIIGPTAVGKSAFALEVAERIGGEILSCDSMAVYRGLDIGTDKPSAADRRRVPHHLLDVAEPGAYFSAGAFRRAALGAIENIKARGRTCVVTGGTGLYYRALTRGLAGLPGRQEKLRERLCRKAERSGPESLHRILRRVDPESAERIMPRDALRLIRAIEVYFTTGRPLSAWFAEQGELQRPPLRWVRVGLTAPRSWLYTRIEERVDSMMRAGLLDEVKRLRERGVLTGPVAKAIGYGELAAFLEGLTSIEEAVARIKLRSRHLAKRQLAWFKKEEGIQWHSVDKEAWPNDAMEFIQRQLEKAPRRA